MTDLTPPVPVPTASRLGAFYTELLDHDISHTLAEQLVRDAAAHLFSHEPLVVETDPGQSVGTITVRISPLMDQEAFEKLVREIREGAEQAAAAGPRSADQ